MPLALLAALLMLASEKADYERARREEAVARLAPAPLPSGLPLLGDGGLGPDGLPRRWVDRPALRSLLWHRRHAELTRAVEELQAAFEADPRREPWPADAAQALGTAEPDLVPLLDAWVAAAPESFAPWLARGTHWLEVGWVRRGHRLAKDTPDADFEAMREAFRLAQADLSRAAALRPGLVAAMVSGMMVAKVGGDDPLFAALLQRSLAACPSCLDPRLVALWALQPQWGGSLGQMSEFAEHALPRGDPRRGAMLGTVEIARADQLSQAGRHVEALAAIDRACAASLDVRFLVRRAQARRRDDPAGALADADKAVALRPGDVAPLMARAVIHVTGKRWEAAARDLRAALMADPMVGGDLPANVAGGLVREATRHLEAGRWRDAVRLLDLAAELAPDDPEVQRRREAALTAGVEPSEEAVAELLRTARATPAEVDVLRRVDALLSRRGELPRVVGLWSEYLAAHPDCGRAYLERGGARYQLGQVAEARADALRACELGVSEGCARALPASP